MRNTRPDDVGRRLSPAGRATVALILALAWLGSTALAAPGRALGVTLFQLTVAAYGFTPAGSGTISSRDGRVNCGVTLGVTHGQCVVDYAAGSSVTIDVSPTFDSDACEMSQGCRSAYTITVNVDTAINVWNYGFKKARAHIEVHTLGTGSGNVTGTGGINCPEGCAVYVPLGTQMALTEHADAGSMFTGWDSDSPCSNPTGATCSFPATDDWAIYATFILSPIPSPGPTSTPSARPTSTPMPTPATTATSSRTPSAAPSAAQPSSRPSSAVPPASPGSGATATPALNETTAPTDPGPTDSAATSGAPTVQPLDTFGPNAISTGPTVGGSPAVFVAILVLLAGALLIGIGLGARTRSRRSQQRA